MRAYETTWITVRPHQGLWPRHDPGMPRSGPTSGRFGTGGGGVMEVPNARRRLTALVCGAGVAVEGVTGDDLMHDPEEMESQGCRAGSRVAASSDTRENIRCASWRAGVPPQSRVPLRG